MSIKIALSVYNIDNKHLSSSEKHVLVRLALYAEDNGKNIYPSYEHISKQTGFSRRAVINVMNGLTQKGILKKKKRRKKNGNDTNYYVIDLEKLKELDEKSSDLNSLSSEPLSPSSEFKSPEVVKQIHHPSELGSPKSKVKVREKVKTHSKVDFAGSVDGVCLSSLSQKEFQAKELGFQTLCNLWPKKEGLEAAQKIYSQIVPDEISSETLLEAAMRKIKSLESKYPHESDRIRYCPQLNNWLEKKSYHDQPHVSEINASVPISVMKKKAALKRAEENLRSRMKPQ